MSSLSHRFNDLSPVSRIALLAAILIPVIVVIALLALADPAPPAAVEVDTVAFNRALAEGDASLAEGNMAEALASYDEAAQANPVSPA
ncbi:MAG: hypothetical protein KC487_06060, partial [Anaerolineae bacterium]|nr:hypothetical protein [Anaerolineae bacterium]